MQHILPSDPQLDYMGRVDFTDPQRPLLVFAGSTVTVRFEGESLLCTLQNHYYWNDNYLGVQIDQQPLKKLYLNPDGRERTYTLADNLPYGPHTVQLVKLQDSPHYLTVCSFTLPEEGAHLLPMETPSLRRMEFFGDSVTVGCITDAFGYEGQLDMPNRGEYCNAYNSYAMQTARRLNARVHLTSQGGVALLSGTGWFGEPHDTMGMEELYDKLRYVQELGEITPWDFSRYVPQVVVVAIGQNDSHQHVPPDIDPGEDAGYREMWQQHYEQFIRRLMALYPKATIICATTVMRHHPVWDKMIGTAVRLVGEARVHHFLYSNNGDGTNGHVRASEGFHMAEELAAYVESLGEDIWND